MSRRTRSGAGVWGRMALGALALLAADVLAQNPTPRSPFPVILSGGRASHGKPVVADLGLVAGKKSIVFGTNVGRLYVVNHDGTVASGFPVVLPGDVLSSPAIGDVDGDGAPDIVVGYGSTLEVPSDGGVRAYRRNGTLIWQRESVHFNAYDHEPVMSTPAIGDVDGDGVQEVAWGSLDAYVYLVRGTDGQDEPGWPVMVRDTVFSSPALFDLDSDGKTEIIIGVDAHEEDTPYNTPDGGCLRVFRHDATAFPGFPQCVNEVIISAPAVGDINGDGKPEIVVGTGLYYQHTPHYVFAFTCDGSQASGWPVITEGQVATAPALADLDGNGVLDVVVTDNNVPPSTTFHVYGFRGNGTQMWKTQPKDYFGNTLNAGEPLIADILGDGTYEVIIPLNTELAVLSSAGVQLTDNGTHFAGSFSLFTDTSLSGGAVADLDNDGAAVDIVAISAEPFPAATNTKVFVWSGKAAGAQPWGMFRQNARRTGVYPGTLACGEVTSPTRFYTLTPCRIADTRDPVGPYGGPSLPAGSARDFVLTGVCGVPSDAKSVSVNLTVVPTVGGFLRYYPAGSSPTTATAISFAALRVIANNGMAKLGLNGALTIESGQASGSCHLIIDTNGYYK